MAGESNLSTVFLSWLNSNASPAYSTYASKIDALVKIAELGPIEGGAHLGHGTIANALASRL